MDQFTQILSTFSPTSDPYSDPEQYYTDDFSPTEMSIEMANTDLPFFKPNLTVRKFFNVSIPINEKINFDIFDNKPNLTDQFNKLDLIPPIHPSTNFALFLCSLVFAMFWVTYITFFNSRVVGALATRVANNFLHLFVSGSYVKVIQVLI